MQCLQRFISFLIWDYFYVNEFALRELILSFKKSPTGKGIQIAFVASLLVNQLLQLCTARTVWSDAVIRPARFRPLRSL